MVDVSASDQRLLLRVGGVVAGEVHPSWLDLLSQADSPFLVPAERDGSGEVTLGAPAKKRDDAQAACDALSAAVDAWAQALHARNIPSGWRGERVRAAGAASCFILPAGAAAVATATAAVQQRHDTTEAAAWPSLPPPLQACIACRLHAWTLTAGTRSPTP